MLKQEQIDHTAYQARVKRLRTSELEYRITDAKAAIAAMPDNPKCGYYQDEINYCAAELKIRRAKKFAIGSRVKVNHSGIRTGKVYGFVMGEKSRNNSQIVIELDDSCGLQGSGFYVSLLVCHIDWVNPE